jgi:phosphate transport system permease protein
MSSLSALGLDTSALPDPTAPLTATGNLRRRAVVSRAVDSVATVSALCAVAMLGIVVEGVVSRGAPALGADFIVKNPVGLAEGGIANYILGTAEIVAVGAAIALPLGILTGLYLTEFAGARSPVARVLKLALDLMQGLPTIVVGLFVYGLIVIPAHQQSGIAAALALAIVMLPLMARASQEVLLLVPGSLREAADALGVSRWRSVLSVIIPPALGGIATGAILAIARAAGETAPVLITNSIFAPSSTQLNLFHGVPTIPILILNTSDLAVQGAFTRAWGAAFVLLVFILAANIAARLLLARNRRKMGA